MVEVQDVNDPPRFADQQGTMVAITEVRNRVQCI